METSQVKHQNKLEAAQIMNHQHEPTNGTVSHKVEKSNISRKERRKEWWSKSKKIKTQLEPSEDSRIKDKTESVETSEQGTGEQINHGESEAQRPKLRNRDTIARPDSLKYEPDFNRGFHSKIMQSLYTDTPKKKKNKRINESLSKTTKRKSMSPPAISEPENAKRTKDVDLNEVFDSYKFSMKLINGEVDVSKNAAGKESKDKYVLFIGNLPFDITREQLEEHFRKTGGIKSIRIPKVKGTDNGRGFAYMEFDGRISHGIALRLHQTTLGGRKINVEFTSIGGGKSVARKEKLQLKNKKRRNMKMQ